MQNSTKLLNKIQEVWYQSFIFDIISDNVLQIFTMMNNLLSINIFWGNLFTPHISNCGGGLKQD